ncbi:hybrid sensor histidine kinase/response regulator [Flavobacterium lindanitolerans]|jgi:signal transduction histidine kinase/DNA-binding response OmpR family regulator|uniref:hybrid sensor histidine kinase/response regulator n=1 Tax=Flavobacterium lindanitolerans TaxID=428988 RepID=UPI0023F4BCD4|nr:ATP-binding protein [Flavobacterium lindanitolerans]
MSQKPRSLKVKVIIGYLLLFVIAALSVWFIYSEILKIATPSNNANADSQKVIRVSNAIASLYASETVGRNSILTGSKADLNEYTKLLDSIKLEIEAIKSEADKTQLPKLDTIQYLLQRKKNSINEIIEFRKYLDTRATYKRAERKVYYTKDSLVKKIKPVQFSGRQQYRSFLNEVLTKKQLDSLSKLPLSNDSLTMAIQGAIRKEASREIDKQYELVGKEQKMLDENRYISDQLRTVLSSLEKQMLEKSYAKINESKRAIDNTIQTIAWVGAITFCLLIVFGYIIIRDLTINQNYRNQLEALNAEKEDLLRSKMMLLATVTHDIQTPLGSVIGFSDLLKNTDVNPKQLQYLDNIKHSSNYILKLVNDLVDFSKLENNRINIEKVSFNFKDLIESTCKPLEPNAENKGIELNWDVEEVLDDSFISDPYRLKQILTNLISNAIKFTQEGSVEVHARVESATIVVSVIDTGIGIAKNKQKAVFKEFTQAHAGIEKKFGGTGLGLTIAKRMLQLLDGDIVVDSEENKGSIFTITIPAIKSEAEAVEVGVPNLDSETEFLKDKRILIVDDDAMQLSLMKEIFANYPVKVTTLVDAAKVRNLLEHEQFDLVLSDIQMPNIDGFELVRIIRNNNNPEIAAIPVIALSGKRNLNPEDFTSKGFTAFHPKPLRLEELLLLMKSIFNGKPVDVAVQVAEARKDEKLFDLSSLNKFTQNDPVSLKLIVDTFITSVSENTEALRQATCEMNLKRMSEVAHKMIPMLKQMEVYSISDLLEPIEDQSLEYDKEEMEKYVAIIFRKLSVLISELEKEIS